MTTVSQINPKAVVKLLSDDATFGTIAHIIASMKYGDAVYDMDILELFAELEDDFRVQLSDQVQQKLQAIMLATSTDSFFEDPESFRAIANTLVEGDPGFLVFDNLTIPEILWSIYEVRLNHPGTEFSPAVKRLIDSEVQDEGLDLEDIDDMEAIPAVENVMTELRNEFIEQLGSLGLPTENVPTL